MATAKTVLRKTHQEAVIKVAGTAAAETISLSADLLPMGVLTPDTGTITVGTGATSVVGVGTNFTAKYVGAQLYDSTDVLIGTVTSVTNITTMVLTANGAVAVTGGAFKTSFRTQLLDGSTQAVNIIGATWTGAATGKITISRNSVTVMTLLADATGQLEFGGQQMIPDSVNNTSDIVVTISGAQAECWLKVRKVSGYKTTIEPEQFGSHDDKTVAGS